MAWLPTTAALYSMMEDKYLRYNLERGVRYQRAIYRHCSNNNKHALRERAMFAALRAYAQHHAQEYGTSARFGFEAKRNAGCFYGISQPADAPEPPPFVWSAWWPSWAPGPPPS